MNEFSEQIWDYYRSNARTMPWRDSPTFYNVLVSELMLQQTQVTRVIPKFEAFMEQFPTISDLAHASLADVIGLWVGLGYNRRAKYLHEASKYVVAYGQPKTLNECIKLPGVGKNTAAAIMNYAYNIPTPYVETNIRTVFINYFFNGQSDISDAQIMQLVAASIDAENPREWFWAIMDYGAYLKSQGMANLSASKHYKKQSALAGSLREMRGWIIKGLADGTPTAKLRHQFGDDSRFNKAIEGLKRDGMIHETNGILYLTK